MSNALERIKIEREVDVLHANLTKDIHHKLREMNYLNEPTEPILHIVLDNGKKEIAESFGFINFKIIDGIIQELSKDYIQKELKKVPHYDNKLMLASLLQNLVKQLNRQQTGTSIKLAAKSDFTIVISAYVYSEKNTDEVGMAFKILTFHRKTALKKIPNLYDNKEISQDKDKRAEQDDKAEKIEEEKRRKEAARKLAAANKLRKEMRAKKAQKKKRNVYG